MSLALFLAAIACFVLALITVLVPTTILGAPGLAWLIGGLLAWFLGDHVPAISLPSQTFVRRNPT